MFVTGLVPFEQIMHPALKLVQSDVFEMGGNARESLDAR